MYIIYNTLYINIIIYMIQNGYPSQALPAFLNAAAVAPESLGSHGRACRERRGESHRLGGERRGGRGQRCIEGGLFKGGSWDLMGFNGI